MRVMYATHRRAGALPLLEIRELGSGSLARPHADGRGVTREEGYAHPLSISYIARRGGS